MAKKRWKVKGGTVYLLLVVAVAEELWLEYQTIGSDARYRIYITILPTVAGCLLLLYYRWHFLAKSCSELKGALPMIFLVLFYGLQGILFSYLSFGVLAKTVWNYTNKKVADGHAVEVIACPVIQFEQRKNSYIYYLFRDKKMKLNVRYETLAAYEGEDADKYSLQFTARKGIWGYCLVEAWTIEKSLP